MRSVATGIYRTARIIHRRAHCRKNALQLGHVLPVPALELPQNTIRATPELKSTSLPLLQYLSFLLESPVCGPCLERSRVASRSSRGEFMQNHLQRLPPKSALRPFETAARHENFSVVADEISVTQSAVSKQIRQLEKHLGVPLILRNGRNIELTAAGRDLHHAIANGLIQIARSCEQLQRGKRSDQVAITMRSPFANQFL
ncbi:MAG: LysR family transcriptional regulator, partial [Boseongicola sp. SB0673_bin_14]|nr:LysR family transcriptional regulator [Boseongicola sp. SB0673_bin_14]